ncbi:MAG: DUF262 domain-containing protein [Bacteroidetes bacterium]|nr:MAG: DUF262 domain-containing protein [Bacteroidota bacterium]
MNNNKYTPANINNLKFSIPLYQRLFEWDKNQINQLMNDLYQSYTKDNSNPYYIGMLTVSKEKNDLYVLVDGQQRFTLLMLMGIVFQTKDWKTFSTEDRLKFFARKNDEEYLKNKISIPTTNVRNLDDYKNTKMENAITTIHNFVNAKEDKDKFINYIYNNTTFFISELPKDYSSQDLNRYFESMNATGRGLENHEILKVILLKKIIDNKEFYTKIWNAVSEMDKPLIRQKTCREKNEKVNWLNILENICDPFELFKYCNASCDNTNKIRTGNDKNKFDSIKEIKPSNILPSKQFRTRNERAILNFSEFLLQVLWLQLTEDERKKTSGFHNSHKLLETFEKHLSNDKTEHFFSNLLKYRVLFDYFILRINSNESNDISYSLNFKDNNNDNNGILEALKQYQSMLYVSTSSNLWLTPILNYLKDNIRINAEDFLKKLKEIDNERHSNDNLTLIYEKIDRYWFWRLDYYLWEKRNEYFNEKEALKIAQNYLFKTNRSIEHIAPQNPKSKSWVLLDNELLHLFGNLVMISSGQNSSLQNESFEVKRAHVEAFINRSKYGSIESLKMLKVYEFNEWTIKNLENHQNEMIEVLKKSYLETNPEKYSEIINKLKNSKIKSNKI